MASGLFRRGSRYAARATLLISLGVSSGDAIKRAVQRTFDHWCDVEGIDIEPDPELNQLRQFARRFRHYLDEADAVYDATGQVVPDTPNIAARQAVRDLVTRGVLRELF
jgi:hypothetical protein